MAEVFISYAREDRAHAEKLAAEIEAVGLTVWWDRDLLPAEKWDETIERELDAAAAVVVIWTPISVTNPNVREEALEAREQDKLAPVMVGDCRPPLFFRRHQFEDLTSWSGQPEALSFQRLAIQLVAYARGPEVADQLPLDDETAPRLNLSAVAKVEKASAIGRWLSLGAMLAVVVGVIAYIRGFDMLGVIGAYNATILVLAGSAIALFRAAEGALPAGPKALVARWLAGEKSFSSSQAFLTMFEGVFGKRHWTLGCLARSTVATLFVYVVLLALFIDIERLFAQVSAPGAFSPEIRGKDWQLKEKLEKSALLLLVVVPLTNIFADFISLWQTRKVLQFSANGRLPLWLGVVLDALLTGAVFIILLPLGPMIAIFCSDGAIGGGGAGGAAEIPYTAFSPEAWAAAVGFVPEVWRGFWAIFEGHPIGEIDAVLTAEASLSTTTLLIAFATTFITSVWLWLALLAAPIFWLMNAGRRKGAGWLGRFTGAARRPIQTLGYGAAASVLAVGLAGGALAGAIGGERKPTPFRDCDACPWMVAIPGGSFIMGSPEDEKGREVTEGPQRKVTIQPFAMGVYEVTFREWEACVADGYCQSQTKPRDYNWGRGTRPVVGVSWNDISGERGFIAWLNSKVKGAPYRLPSEAEWEYATRAGTTTRYWMGDEISHRDANFSAGGGFITQAQVDFAGRARGQTLPVGAFAPNPFGLHDVHGNVWEWVQDCWHGSYDAAPIDGSAWMEAGGGDCSSAVIRGGSWFDNPQYLRSAIRLRRRRDGRYSIVGFRVARTHVE